MEGSPALSGPLTIMSTTSLESRQRHGQSLYRQKDYNAALTIFYELVSEVYQPPISLLDNLAATYIKLNQLPEALKAGKRMISHAKSDSSGYLRTGQALRMMGRKDTALKIYVYGLKHVDAQCEGARLLTGMRDKLTQEATGTKKLDPLSQLPFELIEIILKLFSLKDLANLRRVSKKWNDLITTSPQLWTSLDFSGISKRLKVSALKACIQRGQRRTTSVHVPPVHYSNFDHYRFIVAHCPRLEHLHVQEDFSGISLISAVSMAKSLRHLQIECDGMSFNTMTELLRSRPTLEIVQMAGVKGPRWSPNWEGDLSNLKSLCIGLHCSWIQSEHDFGLSQLQEKTPGLQNLLVHPPLHWTSQPQYFSIFSRWTSLQRIDIDASIIHVDELLLLPQTLKDIGLKCTRLEPQFPSVDLKSKWPELNNLQLRIIAPLNRTQTESFLANNSAGIEYFRYAFMIDEPVLVECLEVGLLANVRVLELADGAGTDGLLAAVARHCPLLEQVKFASNPNLTGVGIKNLLAPPSTSGPGSESASKNTAKVQKIWLENCQGVSHDAVEWALAKGVKVTIRRLFDSGRATGVHGRRVRHGD